MEQAPPSREPLRQNDSGWREMFDGNLHPILSRAAVAPGMKTQETWTDHQFQHGQCRPNGGPAGGDGSLHRQSRVLILTRTLAKLLAPMASRSTRFHPALSIQAVPPEELAGVVKRIPAGYVGSVDDTVAAVRFLSERRALRQRGESASQRRLGHLIVPDSLWQERMAPMRTAMT